MTTADEKMREEFEEWYLSEVDMDADFHLFLDTPYYHDSHTQMAWLGWQQCAARQEGYPGIAHDLELMKASAAQYSERIKELEQQLTAITAERDEWRRKATSYIVYSQCEKHMGQPYTISCMGMIHTVYKCTTCEKGE